MTKRYTRTNEEQALIRMFQGLSSAGKYKIAKARKFPNSIVDNFDLFKTYFLSDEGLAAVMKQLTENEIILLNILHFNEWITDVSIFEAVYVEAPKSQDNYWRRHQSFTQKYGPVVKKVQNKLVHKGVLVHYEQAQGKTKTEKQRYMFPAAFAPYLPSPFFKTQSLSGVGTASDKKIRKELLEAIQSTSSNKNGKNFSIRNRKLHIGSTLLTTQAVETLQLHRWGASNGATIMNDGFGLEGKHLSAFVLHYLKLLPKGEWFSADSIASLLAAWNAPIKIVRVDNSQTDYSRYKPSAWCEAGWNVGVLQKKQEKGTAFYRLAEAATATDFNQYLKLTTKEALTIDLQKIPFADLAVFANLATFLPTQSSTVEVVPDMVNISDIPATIWEHPLTKWLEKNAPTFTKAFSHYRKNYGKEIVHTNLLVAKITDLSLRVLIEKGLTKKYGVQVLSEEFIAFPKEALSLVQKLVTKSGNVIKYKEAK